jgi:hypothetical protein
LPRLVADGLTGNVHSVFDLQLQTETVFRRGSRAGLPPRAEPPVGLCRASHSYPACDYVDRLPTVRVAVCSFDGLWGFPVSNGSSRYGTRKTAIAALSEVAAMAGRASDETATIHYGQPRRGRNRITAFPILCAEAGRISIVRQVLRFNRELLHPAKKPRAVVSLAAAARVPYKFACGWD